MSLAVLFGFLSAVIAWVLVCGAFLVRRSVAQRSFIAGMWVLGFENVFGALVADASVPERMAYWQNWSLTATSLLPGTWLLFSLTYARGNYREFIGRWRFALAAAFIAPLTLAVLFRDNLIVDVHVAEAHGWVFALGWSGMAMYFFSLVTCVLVLTNLERTYRASVGTM